MKDDGELIISRGMSGTYVTWRDGDMIRDTWALHIDPGPSDELARRMFRELAQLKLPQFYEREGEPSEAEHVAYTLENGPDPDDSPEERAETYTRAVARAVEILRGKP
jgi:hypothetical protein